MKELEKFINETNADRAWVCATNNVLAFRVGNNENWTDNNQVLNGDCKLKMKLFFTETIKPEKLIEILYFAEAYDFVLH